jgi:hypothetical protein
MALILVMEEELEGVQEEVKAEEVKVYFFYAIEI